jgi:hypothetical protein
VKQSTFERHAIDSARTGPLVTHGVTRPADLCFSKAPTWCGDRRDNATTYPPAVTCAGCLVTR